MDRRPRCGQGVDHLCLSLWLPGPDVCPVQSVSEDAFHYIIDTDAVPVRSEIDVIDVQVFPRTIALDSDITFQSAVHRQPQHLHICRKHENIVLGQYYIDGIRNEQPSASFSAREKDPLHFIPPFPEVCNRDFRGGGGKFGLCVSGNVPGCSGAGGSEYQGCRQENEMLFHTMRIL